MADNQWVLVNKENGDELIFTSRAEYLAVKYTGGYRDKQGAAKENPRPQRRERREPVNDTPTVEHPASN